MAEVSETKHSTEETDRRQAKVKRSALVYKKRFSSMTDVSQRFTRLSALGRLPGDLTSSSASMKALQINDTNDQQKKRCQIVCGKLALIAQPALALVKVYFCSNPDDSSLERKFLWSVVIPKLRTQFQDQWDVEFKVVDPSVSCERIKFFERDRIREIDDCYRKSLSVCFMAFVGQKYWTNIVPLCISVEIFEILLRVAYNENSSNCSLIERCYERDENALPPQYVLKGEEQDDKLLSELRMLLCDIAQKALDGALVTPAEADQFLTSCFDVELQRGLNCTDGKIATSSVNYVRTISDLESEDNPARVSKYVDILPDSNGLIVTNAVEALRDDMAQEKIRLIREKWIPRLILENKQHTKVYKCSVKWLPPAGLKTETHKQYLDEFCAMVSLSLHKQTAKKVDSVKENLAVSEALCHALIAKHLFRSYHGILHDVHDQINKYLLGTSLLPLIFNGPPGSGKTYIMAAIANALTESLQYPANSICIVRFVGQTFSSSWSVLLLNSVCSQLEECLELPSESPGIWCTDLSEAAQRLLQLLGHASAKQPVVILIDAIDRLKDIDELKALFAWLPFNLPRHVKFIFSCRTGCRAFSCTAKDAGKSKFPVVENRFLKSKEYVAFLHGLLAKSGRKITTGQHVFATRATRLVQENGISYNPTTPLMATYVHLHAVRWRSSTNVTANTIGQGEKNVIKQLLLQLGQTYGRAFVRTAVLLLSVVEFGITEQELEEIQHCTESVRSEVKKRLLGQSASSTSDGNCGDQVQSTIATFTSHFLSNISSLTFSKYIKGCELYCWANESTKVAVIALYTDEELHGVQQSLMDYYNNYVTDYLLPRKTPLKSSHVCVEMYSLLLRCGKYSELTRRCLLNYGWLYTVLRSANVVHILFLFERAYNWSKEKYLLVMERAVRLACHLINRSKSAFAGELYTRLLPFVSRLPALRPLVSKCTERGSWDGLLLPAGVQAQAPGAPLRVSFSESQTINDSILTYENASALCLTYCCGNMLKTFDVVYGELIREVMFKENIQWIKISKDHKNLIILGSSQQTLFILDEATCCCRHKVSIQGCFDSGHKQSASKIDATTSGTIFALWARNGIQVILLFDLKNGNVFQRLICEEQVIQCLISDDERFVFASHLPQSVQVFSSASGQCLSRLQPTNSTGDNILQIFESPPNRFLTVHASGFVHVWQSSASDGAYKHDYELDSRSCTTVKQAAVSSCQSESGELLAVVKPSELDVWNVKSLKHECEIKARKDEQFSSACFTKTETCLLVTLAGNDFSFYVWSVKDAECIAVLDGHSGCLRATQIPSFNSGDACPFWAVTLADDDSIKVWNLENVPLISSLSCTGRPIRSVFCLEQHTVTTDGSDKIVLWDTSNGDIVFFMKHATQVRHCCVSDKTYKLVSADAAGCQYVWSLATGENLIKIQGPEVQCILITPNQQLVVSMLSSKSDGKAPHTDVSKVWHLETAQVVCSFSYPLHQIQVTSKNTFLVGVTPDGRLAAVNLWVGMLSKVLTRPGASVVMVQALLKRDEVLTCDSKNGVTIWDVDAGAMLISLDVRGTVMQNVCVSETGSILTLRDHRNCIKALDTQTGKMRSVETINVPIMFKTSSNGLYLVYISMKTMPETLPGPDAQYDLVLVKLTNGNILATYPLESAPTCIDIDKNDRKVAVGLEEGRVVVFNVVSKDYAPAYSMTIKKKTTHRAVRHPKQMSNGFWHVYQPKYEQAYPADEHEHQSSSSTLLGRGGQSAPSTSATTSGHRKTSVHLQRGGNKSVNMSRISNSSKVRVFM